jgi:hypothetical protein
VERKRAPKTEVVREDFLGRGGKLDFSWIWKKEQNYLTVLKVRHLK